MIDTLKKMDYANYGITNILVLIETVYLVRCLYEVFKNLCINFLK